MKKKNKNIDINNCLVHFREEVEEYADKNLYPKNADISFDLYNDLLKVNYGVSKKPKLIGELFGVKIKIDPMLNENEIKFYYETI